MSDDIEPEIVGHAPHFTFRSFAAPWALFGVLGALGALGVAAALLFSVGWVFLIALAYRWLWNHAFGAEVTRMLYGADALGYKKALASVALFLLVGWLVSPKKS